MNHLVVTVSAESSIDLLSKHADIILLDQGNEPNAQRIYKSIYIRSHFSRPELQPQNFRDKIEHIVKKARSQNHTIRVVDGMDTVEKIVDFEDKWNQYRIYSQFMPRTYTFDTKRDAENHDNIYKKRLSSRGVDVTTDISAIMGLHNEWIAQELLHIIEELRVYVIRGAVYPVGAVRSSSRTDQKTRAIDVRMLTQDEITFASAVSRRSTELDMIGLDVARTIDGALRLIEVNRSPGFGAFAGLSGVNLSDLLYAEDI